MNSHSPGHRGNGRSHLSSRRSRGSHTVSHWHTHLCLQQPGGQRSVQSLPLPSHCPGVHPPQDAPKPLRSRQHQEHRSPQTGRTTMHSDPNFLAGCRLLHILSLTVPHSELCSAMLRDAQSLHSGEIWPSSTHTLGMVASWA